MDILEEKGFFPSDFVISETTWFYNMSITAEN
jgi:glutamate dehydrogenase